MCTAVPGLDTGVVAPNIEEDDVGELKGLAEIGFQNRLNI